MLNFLADLLIFTHIFHVCRCSLECIFSTILQIFALLDSLECLHISHFPFARFFITRITPLARPYGEMGRDEIQIEIEKKKTEQ